MQITNTPIDELIPYARNSRTHSDEQVAQIAASIREFGFTNPVLIDAEGGIIAGHGRVLAARKLDLHNVPCIVLAHLTDIQKRAYVIADNKLALNSGWDNDMLALELEDMRFTGFEYQVTGFDDKFLDELTGGQETELGLQPDEKLDNFLNGDTKILRLAFDEQQFETIIGALKELQQKTGVDDFSTIIFDLVIKSCKK